MNIMIGREDEDELQKIQLSPEGEKKPGGGKEGTQEAIKAKYKLV